MIKQLLLPLAGVAVFIVLVGLLVKNSGNIKIPGLSTPAPAASAGKTVKIGGVSVKVELATNPQARAQGLSGRTNIPDGTGMLFIFDATDKTPGFWMKGMLTSLDIIWIAGGKIVKIDKNIAPPAAGTSDSALKIYAPGTPVDYVLEVRGGFSDENGISVGTPITIAP